MITSHLLESTTYKSNESPSLMLLNNTILPLGLLAYTILLVLSLKKFKSISDHDYPYLVLYSTIAMQILALLFIYIHTWVLKSNGRGLWLLDILGHCWLMAGDSCCIFLIILLARGWGTRFIMFPDEFVNKIFTVASLVILRYLWTIYNWYNLGTNENGGDHIFDGVGGYLEILIGVVKYSIYLVVWWQGYLKNGPIRGVELKHWRKLDNLLFLAAFIAIVVRLIGISSIDRFDQAYHESIGLLIAIFCNFVMMVILSILMVPKNSPFKFLTDSLGSELQSHDHDHHHNHHHDHNYEHVHGPNCNH